jgi:hypothetical protein
LRIAFLTLLISPRWGSSRFQTTVEVRNRGVASQCEVLRIQAERAVLRCHRCGRSSGLLPELGGSLGFGTVLGNVRTSHEKHGHTSVMLSFFTWICFFRRHLVRYYPDSCSYYIVTGIEDAPSLRLVSQSPSCLVQIGQRTEHKQGIGILVQSTVTALGKAKYALDHRKDMLMWSKNSSVLRYQHLNIYYPCHHAFVPCLK